MPLLQIKWALFSFFFQVCDRNEQIANSGAGCVEQREHGIYRMEIVRWQVIDNCKCVPREKINYHLCTCRKAQELKRCDDNSLLILENLQFTPVNGKCLPSRQVISKEIRKCLTINYIEDISAVE